jgi:hypothetical protein
MGNESTIELKFKITDDGSVVLDKIGSKIQQTGKHVEGMNQSLSIIKWDSIVNLGERAFRTGEQIYNMARKTASAINDIDRMSKISGLASDTYQKLAYAAKMTDVDVESLGKSMKLLAGHMDDVAKGKGDAISLFESIGVSTKDASGKIKTFDQMLEDLADRFKSMPDGVQKVALATDLFGRSGENLIPMLNKGKKGLQEFYEEAQKLGIVLDEKLIKKGSELEDQFKRAESFFATLWMRIVVGSAEAIEALQKYHAAAGFEVSMTKGVRKKEERTSGDIGRGLEGIAESAQTTTYMRQSEAALKAIAAANEKIIEQNYKLSDLYDYEANVLRGQAKLLDERVKAAAIMEELGVKTQAGAEKEIADIAQKFQTLQGKGFKPEEIEQARAKLEEQLRAVAEKYQKPSGWQAQGEEGGVRVWSNVAMDEKTRNVSEMIRKATEEMERMQRAATEITGPKTIMIDYQPVRDANEAALKLRETLQKLGEGVDIPVRISISGREGIDTIEKIEEGLVTRFENKSSRLGQIIRKNIEGVVYYSNE